MIPPRKLLLLPAAARMVVVMAVVTAGRALAKSTVIQGNNGNHFGDARNPDSGNYIGDGFGSGRFK